MESVAIRFGGIRFDSGADAAEYTIESVSGMFAGGAGFKRDEVARTGAHGDFPTPSFRTGRRASWQGLILTENAMEQEHAIRSLEAIVGIGGASQLILDTPVRSVWGMFVGDNMDVSIEVYGRIATYRIGVYAQDPRLYGEVREFPYGASAYNMGNFPSTPELIVTGPKAGGYTVTGPSGRQYIVTEPLGAGQTDRIDLMTGWLYRDGVLLSGAVSQAQVWALQSGGPGFVHTITGGSGLTVRVTDTFM